MTKSVEIFTLLEVCSLLAHEIGHHLLKHTNDLFYTLVNCKFSGTNKLHQDELDSDQFAVNLIFSNLRNNCPSETSISLEYLAGPLVGVIAIALFSSDACEDSCSHPSAKNRWRNIVEVMKVNCSEEEFDTLMVLFNTINDYIQGHLNRWTIKWWI